MITVLSCIAIGALLTALSGGQLRWEGMAYHVGDKTHYMVGSFIRRVPELLFAVLVCYPLHISGLGYDYALTVGVTTPDGLQSLSIPLIAFAFLIAWQGIEMGHYVMYHMGSQPPTARGKRKNSISKIIDPIAKKLGWEIGGRKFCWLGMGIKGAVIGLPLAPFGALNAILWPLAYDSMRILRRKTKVKDDGIAEAEWLSGAFVGALVGIVLIGG